MMLESNFDWRERSFPNDTLMEKVSLTIMIAVLVFAPNDESPSAGRSWLEYGREASG
jgi:hypothetical protein